MNGDLESLTKLVQQFNEADVDVESAGALPLLAHFVPSSRPTRREEAITRRVRESLTP